MPATATATTRTSAKGRPIGVDRQTGYGVIRGAILAEAGPFKTEGRGEFDLEALNGIVSITDQMPKGLKAGWTHPGASSDGLGTYLGRWKNIRVDAGKLRGDLHFAGVATKPAPQHGGTSYAEYLMNLAEEDPDAFESSLRITKVNKLYRRKDDGTLETDAAGRSLPPLWRVEKLAACDVVDSGDATHSGFLSASDFSVRNTNALSHQVTEVLNGIFRNHDKQQTGEALSAFVERYLTNRFGAEEPMSAETPKTPDVNAIVSDMLAAHLAPLQKQIADLSQGIQAEAATRAEQARAQRIVALCTENGRPELAEGFLKDSSIQPGDVALKLLSEIRKSNNLAGDDTPGETDSREKQLGREWDANRETLSSMGVSREEYIKQNLAEVAN